MRTADRIEVERLGGFAGFGGPGARLRSRGSLAAGRLSAAERGQLDAWFAQPASLPAAAPGVTDGFRYRLSRQAADGSTQVVEVPEAQVPPALRDCVQDELI